MLYLIVGLACLPMDNTTWIALVWKGICLPMKPCAMWCWFMICKWSFRLDGLDQFDHVVDRCVVGGCWGRAV